MTEATRPRPRTRERIEMKNSVVSTIVPGQLTVYTYGGFAPVCYKNPAGQLIGLDVSFLTRFAESLGLAIVTKEERFEVLWKLPGVDICDVAGAGIMKRDDRKIGPDASWSDEYFDVKRSLLVQASEKKTFDDHQNLKGKKIVVTRGSTADIDAQTRYPGCKPLLYVDEVAKGQVDAQDYIVRELVAKDKNYAFGEGDVSNQYLRDKYGSLVAGGLDLGDVHPIDNVKETFNFITRNASTGVLGRLNQFIKDNKDRYAFK